MKRIVGVALLLLLAGVPAFCKTHEETYPVLCSVLWAAVKDTLRNSGKYGIIGIDNMEMTASFILAGRWGESGGKSLYSNNNLDPAG